MDTPASTEDDRPNPCDFGVYLPWACSELRINVAVVVNKIAQVENASGITPDQKKLKTQRSRMSQSKGVVEDRDDSTSALTLPGMIRIWAVYDKFNNLIHLEIDKCRNVNREVLRIIGLIIPFQMFVQTLVIKGRIDKYTVPEIVRFLPNTNITDMNLDNCFVGEANFHLLLEKDGPLKFLSLARCKLNDASIQLLAENLAYPKPGSKNLTTLNLSTNEITDIGAGYLSEALRSNRQLIYLNLCGNRLTDDGAVKILKSLMEFSMTADELEGKRARTMDYLRQRASMLDKVMKDLTSGDDKKRNCSRATSVSGKLKPQKGETISNIDKAELLVDGLLGAYKEPFHAEDTVFKNEIMYSFGNNVLSYLNFGYNNLSFVTVDALLEVLRNQRLLDRKPRGLMKVLLDGCPIPSNCRELREVEEILEAVMYLSSKKFPSMQLRKKKN